MLPIAFALASMALSAMQKQEAAKKAAQQQIAQDSQARFSEMLAQQQSRQTTPAEQEDISFQAPEEGPISMEPGVHFQIGDIRDATPEEAARTNREMYPGTVSNPFPSGVYAQDENERKRQLFLSALSSANRGSY
jgi:hypothetical protein